MFKIGSTDYSNRVIAGTYAVNEEDVFEEWKDVTGKKHRQLVRTRVNGDFTMWFNDIDEYTEFITTYETARINGSRAVEVTVMVNNTNEEKEINAFLTFKPVRNRRGDWKDYMEQFKVELEEE